MQAHIHTSSDKPLTSPLVPEAQMADSVTPDAPDKASSPAAAPQEEARRRDQSSSSLRETLDEHKGKLAISAAAMLGLLIYYKWGEKSLAKENPAEYERLRRLREGLRHAEHGRRAGDKPALAAATSAKPEK